MTNYDRNGSNFKIKKKNIVWSTMSKVSLLSILIIILLTLSSYFTSLSFITSYIWVFFVGGIFSGIELASRYKDEPLNAINSLPGFSYLSINGGICCFGYFISTTFSFNIEVADYLNSTAQKASDILIASMTSFLVMRSSFLTLGSENNQVDLGLNVIIKKLILIVDRQVDRYQASSRTENITYLLSGISLKQLEIQVLPLCLQVMQNVPQEEIDELNREFEKLTIFEKTEHLKEQEEANKLSAGLMIYNLVGYKVLETAIRELELVNDDNPYEKSGGDNSVLGTEQLENSKESQSSDKYEESFEDLIHEITAKKK